VIILKNAGIFAGQDAYNILVRKVRETRRPRSILKPATISDLRDFPKRIISDDQQSQAGIGSDGVNHGLPFSTPTHQI
jgi:hypothetical protein